MTAHVRNSFQFVLDAPVSTAAPLFGPEGERAWAGAHWKPIFLYPEAAQNTEGAVFTIQHGASTSIWVNTMFDVAAGRMQYVYFLPDVLVTTVDVHLTALNVDKTKVAVNYQRTALRASANDEVFRLGKSDLENGPHWKEAIEVFLKAHENTGHGKMAVCKNRHP